MSNNRNQQPKQKRNDTLLKNLPTEVLLKARSTLVSLGGALKYKHENSEKGKHETKEKIPESLKNSRSNPEFSDLRKHKHRSRIDGGGKRDFANAGLKPRPLSVGANKRFDKEMDDFQYGALTKDATSTSQNLQSLENICIQSRLVIPITDRQNNQDTKQINDTSERPRKKLSFREPEIVGGSTNGSATLGRSHKLMGVNSLTKRPNKSFERSESHYSSLDGLETDLESQAMRIVRTVGQAFEVCHKAQGSDQPAASTSSAADEPALTDRASDDPPKEVASECGASESGVTSASKAAEELAEEEPARVRLIELLPPPPKKEGKTQRTSPVGADLPECVTKVEVCADGASLSSQHQLQLLQERLEQQAQQTRAAVAQLLLLRDQLAAEQAARCEAQARTHQLLVHNKELLEHIAALVAHLQERERGSSRPISAQQLTLLPQFQLKVDEDSKDGSRTPCNGYRAQCQNNPLIDLDNHEKTFAQNVDNNNTRLSPTFPRPVDFPSNRPSGPNFGGMTNDQIQNYLILKFQNMNFVNETDITNANADKKPQDFFQNSNAFPNIPPLKSDFSNSDLDSLFTSNCDIQDSSTKECSSQNQTMSVCQSQNSLCSNSQTTTSKDSTPDGVSSDDGIPFIMPLSHNGTLTATGDDGRIRLIVPVSPSPSTTDIPVQEESQNQVSGKTLNVPGSDILLNPPGPITRTTSEKVPNRSEMMTALRLQWTRHTTK